MVPYSTLPVIIAPIIVPNIASHGPIDTEKDNGRRRKPEAS